MVLLGVMLSSWKKHIAKYAAEMNLFFRIPTPPISCMLLCGQLGNTPPICSSLHCD